MGQQGSNPSAEHKSNRGSSELLGNDSNTGQSKNKLFKGFGSKIKSKSKKHQQGCTDADYITSSTPKASRNKQLNNLNISESTLDSTDSTPVRRIHNEELDKSCITASGDSFNEGHPPAHKKINLNDTPKNFMKYQVNTKSTTQSFQGKYDNSKERNLTSESILSILSLEKTPSLTSSVLDIDTVEIELKISTERMSPSREVYLDARSNQSPVEEYLSAPENGSLLSVFTERPSTALSSRTLTPNDDSLNQTPKNTSQEAMSVSFMADDDPVFNKIGHKQIEPKPYVLTSRLLSASGINSTQPANLTKHTNSLTTQKHSKHTTQHKRSNPVASKFCLSLESGMEATSDVFEGEGDGFSSELNWEESDKDTDVECAEVVRREKMIGGALEFGVIIIYFLKFLIICMNLDINIHDFL